MTKINSDTSNLLECETDSSLTKLSIALNPDHEPSRNLEAFQIMHHDGYAGILFSISMLTDQACYSLLLRNEDQIQVFSIDLTNKEELHQELFQTMRSDDSLYGLPLVIGPTTLHTFDAKVMVNLITNLRPDVFDEVRLNLASLINKEAFSKVAIGILPRLEEIVKIININIQKRKAD